MTKRLSSFAVPAALLLLISGAAGQVRLLDVPYVPTKFPVVDEMLSMAGVSKNDIVYDLGCGDGRIVIGAAQKYGARGIGIDLDPERILESEANASSAGVADRVRFYTGDLFEADIREATVVSLYLLTSINLRLRPRLLRELRPGSRVVSHNFAMENWKPDASSEVEVDGVRHDVFLWVIPANASGAWTWTMKIKGKTTTVRADLIQKYQYAKGTVKIGGTEAAIADAKIQGDLVRFRFEAAVAGSPAAFVFEGKLVGQSINGTIRSVVDGETRVWTWKAFRNPTTEKPIDEPPDAG
ncbi:MAG TPA: class I SAM-dependent methyltransferase [Candidatus Aminicenantes bacterium]|jgi:precorrin-6B methylase 2|nr:class I SAM-dependent methyltransferase [Acidobacteriota bacterium]OQB59153.1 MAG: Demethylrebeccamycin-D-glucose O-methyltransferase [Candidatus Aminicenantes bacterium ADurb.Bin147]HNQ79898.1 class I SAM-dependent methyltransferase [Candidatus Aminicenantes bacterium]HNT31394.1 class I SAM-dependent methyltransferase [Candidatus Aminicenantes bacterium]HOY98009.1 class I SAM-dependent methyltransferase [Candidatus Aminicenantes bacterium]